jgi:hypothetical protein
MSATLLTFPPPSRLTVQASIQCIDCPWFAMQTGTNAITISLELRERYRRHLAERHPELQFSEVPS